MSIDANGRIWVANYFSVASLFSNTGSPILPSGVTGNGLLDSYGGAVDKNNRFWVANEEGGSGVGSISIFDTTGSAYANTVAGGYNFPIAVYFGTDGAAWVVDYGNSHLSVVDGTTYNSYGSAPYTDQPVHLPGRGCGGLQPERLGRQPEHPTPSPKSPRTAAQSRALRAANGASGVAIDASNNVWVANYYGDSIGLVSSAGVIKSGTNGYVGGGVDHPQVSPSTAAARSGIPTTAARRFLPSPAQPPRLPAPHSPRLRALAPDAALLEAFGIAIDASGNAGSRTSATTSSPSSSVLRCR